LRLEFKTFVPKSLLIKTCANRKKGLTEIPPPPDFIIYFAAVWFG